MKPITNVADAGIVQRSPASNYSTAQTLVLRGASGDVAAGLLRASGLNAVPGLVVDEAFLRVFAAQTMAATTLQLRKVIEAWSPGTVKWSNRPDSEAVLTSVTKSAVDGTPFDLDVTALVTAWMSGGANHGVRLDTTATASAGRAFYSVDAAGTKAQYRPVLYIAASAPPSVPSSFVLTGGARTSRANPVVPWAYSDPFGEPMTAYRFYANPIDGDWDVPAYDSGVILSSIPQHPWANALGDGQDYYYRVEHRNRAGKWSPRSDSQFFGRTVKGTIELVVPGPAPDDVLTDVTPTTVWATSFAQESYEVEFERLNGSRLDWSGARAGDDQDYAPAAPLPIGPAQVTVRAWDTVNRVATPGDPTYVEANATFTIEAGDGVAPVLNLQVGPADVGPAPRLTWDRSGGADGYVVERQVEDGPWTTTSVALSDITIAGSAHAWHDTSAPPRRALTYRVRPVVNGVMGEAVTAAPATMEPQYIWLLDPDDPEWVLPIADQESLSWDMGEQSAFLEIRGSDRVLLVHEAFRGYEGSVSGGFHSDLPDVGDATAQELRDRAWRLKAEPTKVWRLVVADINIPVVVRKVIPIPQPDRDLRYVASFDFAQQGELWW